MFVNEFLNFVWEIKTGVKIKFAFYRCKYNR